MSENPTPGPRHETTDARAIYVWFTGLSVAICCLLIGVAAKLMFDRMLWKERRLSASSLEQMESRNVAASRPQFPPPRLEVSPKMDLAKFQAWEDVQLTTYGWVDRKAGVVRIPIEQAMDLIIQRGLPVRGQPGAPAPYRTVLDMQQARPLERETPAPSPGYTP